MRLSATAARHVVASCRRSHHRAAAEGTVTVTRGTAHSWPDSHLALVCVWVDPLRSPQRGAQSEVSGMLRVTPRAHPRRVLCRQLAWYAPGPLHVASRMHAFGSTPRRFDPAQVGHNGTSRRAGGGADQRHAAGAGAGGPLCTPTSVTAEQSEAMARTSEPSQGPPSASGPPPDRAASGVEKPMRHVVCAAHSNQKNILTLVWFY